MKEAINKFLYRGRVFLLIFITVIVSSKLFAQENVTKYSVSDRKVKYSKKLNRYIGVSYSVDDITFLTLNVDSLVVLDSSRLCVYMSNYNQLQGARYNQAKKIIRNNKPEFVCGTPVLLQKVNDKYCLVLPLSNETHILLRNSRMSHSIVSFKLTWKCNMPPGSEGHQEVVSKHL